MFPDQQVSEPQLSDEDISFAQALLIEAVDSSREMGYVQILFEKAAYKVPTDKIYLILKYTRWCSTLFGGILGVSGQLGFKRVS